MKAELEPVPTISCYLHPRFFGSERELKHDASLVKINFQGQTSWQVVCRDCQARLKERNRG